MLSLLAASSAYNAPLSAPAQTGVRRAVGPVMQKKIITFEGYDGSALFEPREIDYKRPPVKILSRINELKISTAIAEAGLLSAAEDAGVFSTLENLGAFSTIEKLLPTIEKIGALSILEEQVDTDPGLLFTLANFLIVFGPVLLTLQICGFVPTPSGVLVVPEVGVCLATLVAGVAVFGLAFVVSILQDDDQEGIKLFR